MSENQPPEAGDNVGPEAVVAERRGISLVWIIPVVAAIIGATLAYRTISQRGPLITVMFKTAAGIQPGKTQIRYLAVEVGVVETVQVAAGRDHVVVTARVHKAAEQALTEGARFWVVRPRIGRGGVSGLSTLLSGAYIALDPGKAGAAKQLSFTGLEVEPLDVGSGKSLDIVLNSATVRGLGPGTAIFYRGFQIGEVVSDEISKDEQSIVTHARIDGPHTDIVRTNSRFRDASGISVSASIDGVEMYMESIVALIVGGIVVDTPGTPGPAATAGATFTLYPAHRSPSAKAAAPRGLHIVAEAHRLGSVKVGDVVYYREEKVGEVLSHELNDDATAVGIHIVIAEPYDRLIRTNTVFWNASGIRAKLGLTGVKIETESLESMLKGGIALATPTSPGARVKAGAVFKLHSESDKSWFDWKPRIWLGRGSAPAGAASSAASAAATGSAASPAAQAEPVDHHYKGEAAGAPGSTHHWYSHGRPSRPGR